VRVDFICGGYFLTKRGPHRAYGRATLERPGNFVTLSPERVHFFPDSWAISWVTESEATRAETATALGIPASSLPALISRVTGAFEELFFWPNVIPTVAAARQLLQMVPPSPGWLIVGFGVAEDDVAGLLERNAPPAQKPGFAPTGSGGVFEVLAKRQPLEPGSVELGFDVLEIGYGMLWHTCLDFDLAATRAYAGALNANGLLPDYAAATDAARVLTNQLHAANRGTVTAAQIVHYRAGGGS
jgi:hypothetical protein